ncbi:MAG: CopG family ribbon-helix-helix protein [Candidatus Binatia bacterium]
MPRLTLSIPDELLTKLDRRAKREQRSRSELLREAARRYLSHPQEPLRQQAAPSKNSPRPRQKWTPAKLTQYLLDKGVVIRGCPGLDTLVGPVTGPVNMEHVLEIGKKLKGLSQQIIDDREDRV